MSRPDLKINGAEFKAWQAADWGHPEAHWDDYTMLIDSVEVEDYDPETLADTAVIEIYGGVVFVGEKELSPKTHFNRWKKAQTTVSVVVEIDKDRLEEFKAAVKAIGGKVAA